MNYTFPKIQKAADSLQIQFDQLKNKADILKSSLVKDLFSELKSLPPEQRSTYGQEANRLISEIKEMISINGDKDNQLDAIDITAPFDINMSSLTSADYLPSQYGSIHPLSREMTKVLDIYYRMGFEAVESREIDDDYHMFGSLNFPEDHPARDDYDTFLTTQTDTDGQAYIAPAHTSTMQNRVLKSYKHNLDSGKPIAVVIPGRVFRNEDLDPRHEHTFYQLEGVYVDKNVNAGQLLATLKTFLQTYYDKDLEIKTQPFYFPFTEPSFEFSLSCPFCDKSGCNICSQSGWIELLGCGMIHPNVLRQAGIDVNTYTGFAWGGGIERLVMMKYAVDDIRHFESAKLDFLRQFKS